MKIKNIINWKLFRILLSAGVFGVVAIFPYLLTVQGDILKELPTPTHIVLLLSLIQTTFLISIAIFIGLLLGKKVGLGAPLISNWILKRPIKEELKSVGILGIKLGLLAGLMIIGLDYIFTLFMEPITFASAPLWQGFLGSFYGGIVEEILMRLFLVTLLVWAMCKFSKTDDSKPSTTVVWIAIIFAAVIFGLGHLPVTATLTAITPLVIFRAILLNGIGGIIFGWLYWKKGLEAAIIAHFTVDIVLLVVLPLVLMIG
ncbi:CPBP family intramembrane metalloprotease [Candidatus Kaiserbacteria bacterium]|nr:MAG: CPBP family intramembrane metalloprotease [Candidatus Kaiserbacteria bacterium]